MRNAGLPMSKEHAEAAGIDRESLEIFFKNWQERA
jgi:hypothetical protein